MNYLSVENISKSFGVRTLFENISFGINQGDKIAFVAKNGTGKTSLLKILAGFDTPDTGQVTFRRGVKVGFLQQEPALDLALSVEQVVFGGDSEQLRAIERYEKAVNDPSHADDFQAAYDKMEELHAWEYELKIKNILSRLKLDSSLDMPLSKLSGGQRRRVALAQLLVESPDFMILDEPTNHLDLDMVEWMEEFLTKENITLFMVTHDRYFLDRICTDILELENGSLSRYKGNYGYYLEKKAERQAADDSFTDKARNLMRTELEWIRKQPRGRGTKAKARVDSFDELKKKASRRIDERALSLEINMERLGSKIIEIHNIRKQWEDGYKIIDGFNYVFKRGERVGIVGKNGTGKTTFLRLVTGEIPVDGGKVVIGETVVFGYYKQEGLEVNPGEKVIEVLKKFGDYIPLAKGRKLSAEQLLERFLFPRSQQYDFVEKLSGGEKRRLYLCTVLIQNPNFLILDEPTNDLDILTLNVLEEFLQEYPGVLVVVSHDRYFMDKIVDHLFVFEGEGVIRDFPGNYSEYRLYESQATGQKKEKEKEKESELAVTGQATADQSPKTTGKFSYKEQREFEQLEKDIPALEGERDEINRKFENPQGLSPEDINTLSMRIKEVADALQKKEFRWMELCERM